VGKSCVAKRVKVEWLFQVGQYVIYKMEVLDIHQLIGGVTKYDKKVALEVKKPKSWCKSVSTFANGIGGRLIWGIANDKTIGRS
jgi:hypothetical protein